MKITIDKPVFNLSLKQLAWLYGPDTIFTTEQSYFVDRFYKIVKYHHCTDCLNVIVYSSNTDGLSTNFPNVQQNWRKFGVLEYII